MQGRSLLLLGVAAILALVTALGLKSRMGSDDANTGPRIVVATIDIPAGAFVRANDFLTFKEWPEDNITESMLVDGQVTLKEFDGSVARRAIQKGEAVVKNVLVKATEGGFMSAVLEQGKRAVSIAVDSTSGNAGFIFPGDKVDLILTLSTGSRQSPVRASETFVEDVRVLAVDQMLDNPENKAMLAKTVTLEVTPKQAEKINVAKDLGKISLSLRSLAKDDDSEKTEDAGEIDLHTLLENAEKSQEESVTRDSDVSSIVTPRMAVGAKVQIIRGGKEREEVEFR
ncbi:MAG: Flp pilus assembly protein CpaB [Alphaproteobacteria bacterium]|nr:Flp pilus assembly protein CpaB [Alphaproteobacteria bacterium]